MKITHTLQRLVVSAALVTLVAAGCGGDEETSGTPSPADRLGAIGDRGPETGDQEGAAAAREKAAANRKVERQQREHRQRLARKKQSDATGKTVAETLRADRVDVPDDYPADAPRYPAAWASQVRRLPNGVMNVMFGSDDSTDKIASWMRSSLPDDGWKIVAERKMGSGSVIQGEKDARRLNVVTSTMGGSDEDVTLIAVVVSQ